MCYKLNCKCNNFISHSSLKSPTNKIKKKPVLVNNSVLTLFNVQLNNFTNVQFLPMLEFEYRLKMYICVHLILNDLK